LYSKISPSSTGFIIKDRVQRYNDQWECDNQWLFKDIEHTP